MAYRKNILIKETRIIVIAKKPPGEGKKNVLAICPGFSSDCVETLEEILIQGKETFLDAGGENFDMVPCLNDSDDHITLLKLLIQKNL
jgi:ferrochelatase